MSNWNWMNKSIEMLPDLKLDMIMIGLLVAWLWDASSATGIDVNVLHLF